VESVYSAVRTESLYKTDTLRLWRVNLTDVFTDRRWMFFVRCMRIVPHSTSIIYTVEPRDMACTVVALCISLWYNTACILITWTSWRQSPVAARSKAWVCRRSLASIAGSNLAGGVGVCLVCVCCQIEVSVTGRSLVQRGPTECGVSNWVWSWSPDSEEALPDWGL
jgi:hypothetical protein